jgi:hypothetical protein
MNVECPLCGAAVNKRGLTAHQSSYRCTAGRTRKEYEQKGYAIFHGMRKSFRLFKKSELKEILSKIIINDITGFYTGKWNKRGGFNYGYWGPNWLLPLWSIRPYIDKISKKIFDNVFINSITNNSLTEEVLTFIAIEEILKNDDIPSKDKREIANMIINGKCDEAIAVAHLKYAGRV